MRSFDKSIIDRIGRTLALWCGLAGVVLINHVVSAAPPPVFPNAPRERETGVIIKVRPGFLPASSGLRASAADPASEVRKWTANAGVANARVLWQGPTTTWRAGAEGDHPGRRTFVLTPEHGVSPETVVKELETLPWIEYAEVDRLLQLHSAPNDPYYSRQWHLDNTGQAYWSIAGIAGSDNDTLAERTGLPGADVQFLSSYNYAGDKTSVRVCIIDTGLDTGHEDLRDRLFLNPGEIPGNGIDDDHNGFVDDVYGWDFSGDVQGTPSDVTPDNDVSDPVGHGTHVGGTVAATVNNGIGIAGVADSARIFSAKIFPNAFFSIAAEAVYYAVLRGARVVNMSWGGAYPSNALQDALAYAHAHGLVLIASMGNSGIEEQLYPSSYSETIAIGASTATDHLAVFSTVGNQIDVVAPGQDVLSLRGAGTDMYAAGGEPDVHIIDDTYYIASGTSMSAPHATGVAAALLSIAPGLSNERVRQILSETADDIVDPYGDGANLPGYDKYTGWGRINLTRALAALPGVFATIDHPSAGEWIGGEVSIEGYATGDGFSGYAIRIAPGHLPEDGDWTTLLSSGTPVSNGVLATWNTEGLNGAYTIRLDAGTDAIVDIPVDIVQEPSAAIMVPPSGATIKLAQTIIGTAAALGFTSYRLEAVGPLPSTTTRTIATASRPVWADTLGTWALDELTPGSYRVRLTLESTEGVRRDSVQVTVEDVFHAGWPITLPGNAHFGISAVDLDGDHIKEIVCPTNKGLWVLAGDSASYNPWDGSVWPRFPGWPRDTLNSYRSAPAFADLDHDGKYEIIIATAHAMNVFTWIGEAYYQWPRPFEAGGSFYGLSVPSVGDIDGDGSLEIAAIDDHGTIRVWRENGLTYVPSQTSFGNIAAAHSTNNALPQVTICDLDRNGKPEVVAIGDEIRIFDGRTGAPYDSLPSPVIASHFSIHGAAIGDFDGDTRRDIAYVAVDGATDYYFVTVASVHQFKDAHDIPYDSAVTLPGWPRYLDVTQDQYLLYSLTAGDIDGDTRPEIFVAPYSLGQGLLYAFHADGSPVVSDSSNGLFARLPGSASSVVVTDIDHDGAPEVVLRVGELLFGPDQIFAYEADGSLANGYPLVFGTGSSTTLGPPIVGDINNDGWSDMVTLQSTGRLVAVWDLVNPAETRPQPWPRFRKDIYNSGVVTTPLYDMLYLGRMIDYIFGGVPFPIYDPTDLNCDKQPDILDIGLLIDYLFAGGSEPCVP